MLDVGPDLKVPAAAVLLGNVYRAWKGGAWLVGVRQAPLGVLEPVGGAAAVEEVEALAEEVRLLVLISIVGFGVLLAVWSVVELLLIIVPVLGVLNRGLTDGDAVVISRVLMVRRRLECRGALG